MMRKLLTFICCLALSSTASAAGIGYLPNAPIMSVGETIDSGGLVVVTAADLSNPGNPDFVINDVSYNAVYTYDTSDMDITATPNFTSSAPGQLELIGTASSADCWSVVCNGSQDPGTWGVLIGGFFATALSPGIHNLVMQSISIYDETNGRVLNLDYGGGPRPIITYTVNPVPIPAAVWLFGSALLGLGAIKRRKAA